MTDTPTQVRHPWRAVLRTVVAFLVARIVVWLTSLGIDLNSFSEAMVDSITEGITVALGGLMTWVLSRGGVEEFLRQYLPFLATGVHTEPEYKARHAS